MKTLVGLSSLDEARRETAITIGTFDGVHVGHRTLIARAKQAATARGVESAVITWDRHPNVTLRPDHVPLLLTTPERKVELIETLGPDLLVVLPFDDALRHMPAERFATDVLGKGLGARTVIIGRGWRFGHRAQGDAELLRRVGEEIGFEVEEVELEEVAGGPVSSTRVRAAVAAGDVALARILLGRHHDIDGEVVHGDHRGKDLGVPTANVLPDPAYACPRHGVYAGRGRVGELWYPAAVNVGVNPTFGGDPDTTPVRIEAYLLGLEADLYGQTLRIEFWERLRDEGRFESVDALVEQMHRDIAATRALVAPAG